MKLSTVLIGIGIIILGINVTWWVIFDGFRVNWKIDKNRCSFDLQFLRKFIKV